jgi:hypothetical protein
LYGPDEAGAMGRGRERKREGGRRREKEGEEKLI